MAFGLKFEAKGVIECYEGDLENLASCQRRDIEFKMIKGDFQLFEGTWSIEQVSKLCPFVKMLLLFMVLLLQLEEIEFVIHSI